MEFNAPGEKLRLALQLPSSKVASDEHKIISSSRIELRLRLSTAKRGGGSMKKHWEALRGGGLVGPCSAIPAREAPGDTRPNIKLPKNNRWIRLLSTDYQGIAY